MPSPHIVAREEWVDSILTTLGNSHCIALIGLSNTGKSTLLRSFDEVAITTRYSELNGRVGVFIYVDCNGMLELSGQGFYELILRNLKERVTDLGPELQTELAGYYQKIIEPDTQFLVPLNFNNAMTAIIAKADFDIVLLFDEFDEAFDTLDGRVFLNLRALKDKYPRNLTYLTATVRRPGSRRSDEQTAEFVELSARNTVTLQPLNRVEADELANELARHSGLPDDLTEDEFDFLWEQAGGHPPLLRASVGHLSELRLNDHQRYADEGFDALFAELQDDITIRAECARLWGQLSSDEREGLIAIKEGRPAQSNTTQMLEEWGLIRYLDDQAMIFSRLLDDFVGRQVAVHTDDPTGIRVDQDSGEAWVQGVPAPPLTELEFKLLALLYERLNKVTDKPLIVERVWGVDYMEEVDDSRIEKLISRLRSKIEPDVSEPRFIMTVRGRGYKLSAE